jgi:hypothetical protein
VLTGRSSREDSLAHVEVEQAGTALSAIAQKLARESNQPRGEVATMNCHFEEGALQRAATMRLPHLTISIRHFTLSSTSLSTRTVALLDNTHMHVRHMLIYFYFSHPLKPLVTSPRRTLHSHPLGTCRSGQRSRRSNTPSAWITFREQSLLLWRSLPPQSICLRENVEIWCR